MTQENKTAMYFHLTDKKKKALKVISKKFNTTQASMIEEAVDIIIIKYSKKYMELDAIMDKFLK